VNLPPSKTRHLAFVLSGAVLLLIGFGWLPIELTAYEFQNWHAILLSGFLFATGIGFVVYKLSRGDE